MRWRWDPKEDLAGHRRACLCKGMAKLMGSGATARVPALFTPDPECGAPQPTPCRDMQLLCLAMPSLCSCTHQTRNKQTGGKKMGNKVLSAKLPAGTQHGKQMFMVPEGVRQ